MRIIFLLISLLCVHVTALAQQYRTHAVKSGETLEGIARFYSVTPYSILQLNPEVKKGLKPSTILVIPSGSGSVEISAASASKVAAPAQKEPVRFIEHRVKRSETLYSLAQQYHITEADIKRFNTALYSRPLEKGERLQIPVYQGASVKQEPASVRRGDLVPYVVKRSEGKWRIAYEHGISEAELLRLNPGMNEVLNEGDTLMVPFVPGNESRMVEDDRYNYYTVLPREGFYRLKVKLGLSQEEIEMLNPEVKALGLQSGMIIKVPKNVTGGMQVAGGKLINSFSLMDSIHTGRPLNIALVMPFKANEVNYDSLELAHEKLRRDRVMNVALDFYSGARIALDSASRLGISVNFKVVDFEGKEQLLSQILNSGSLEGVDAVIGPVQASEVNKIARALGGSRVPVFAPFSNKGLDALPNVFQTLPPEELMRERMFEYMRRNGANKNVLIITDRKNQVVKKRLMEMFPGAKVVDPADDKFIRLEAVRPFLAANKENWVIVETDNTALLSNITGVVNSAQTSDLVITMLTTYKGNAYDSENISNVHLSNLNFHFPAINHVADEQIAFYRQFQSAYGGFPNRYAVRGFDITMDLILRLSYNKDLMGVSSRVGETGYIENNFQYVPSPAGGFYNRAVHVLYYDNLTIKEAIDDANFNSDLSGRPSHRMPSSQK